MLSLMTVKAAWNGETNEKFLKVLKFEKQNESNLLSFSLETEIENESPGCVLENPSQNYSYQVEVNRNLENSILQI
jgi:hypothetical protein